MSTISAIPGPTPIPVHDGNGSTFRAVNTADTSSKPQSIQITQALPPTAAQPAVPQQQAKPDAPVAAKDPAVENFNGIPGQRALPELVPAAVASNEDHLRNSQHRRTVSESAQSPDQDEDVEMEDEKDSDHNSADGDATKGGKKKGVKQQKFFCTDYPPCQLSFTRSEHLARHIRKHTGERPFTCHCNRKFSRLDNLRQHAQTVHVNEDIPLDSLAATGTRFQRQIRTDRVGPAGPVGPTGPARSRASTFSNPSHVGPRRGHGRNLSTSSVNSVSSVSTYGGEDYRRIHPDLSTPRANRLSLDTYGSSADQRHYYVGGPSPTGYSTPASSTFSFPNSSPRYSSGYQSPASMSRPGLYSHRSHNRRLSVPASNPFQSGQSPDTYPSGPRHGHTASHGAIPRSTHHPNMFIKSDGDARRESISNLSQADADWRRRTWHPNTNTGLGPANATGPVPQHIVDLPRPIFSAQQQSTPQTRLPGIDSFDRLASSANSQPARPPSPMQLDPNPPSHPAETTSSHVSPVANNRNSWDTNLQRGFNRLDINNLAPASPAPISSLQRQPPQGVAPINTSHSGPVEEPMTTPLRNKRMGWYRQPPGVNQSQPSPDSLNSDGAPTPVTATAEFHPQIVHSYDSQTPHHMRGVDEPHHSAPAQGPLPEFKRAPPPLPLHQHHHNPTPFGLEKVQENPLSPALPSPQRQHRMGGLEALVAAAAVNSGSQS